MFTFRKLLPSATVVVLAVSAVACGQDTDDASPADSTATADEAAVASAAPPAETAAPPSDVTEVDDAELRLVVADGNDATAQVVDLTTEDVVATLDLPAVASLTSAGRFVVAAARDADRLELIDAGTWTVPHGDHVHHYVADPLLTPLGFDADDPTHVVVHEDLTAVFNDGDGTVVVLGPDPDGAEGLVVVAEVDSGAAHHGVAVALEEHGVVIVTTPVDGEAMPDGVAVVDLATGEETDRFGECPELHGEVSTDEVVAFGCADGVLVLERHDDHWDATKITTADAGERRTATLAAGPEADFLVGDLGRGALVRIDLVDGTATTLSLPAEMSSFLVDPERESVLVATVDGRVHRIDPRTADILQSVAAVDAFDLPSGHGGAPTPRLTVAGDRAYLTDPVAGEVVELGIADELRIARRIAVGGTPASLAVVGAAPGVSR